MITHSMIQPPREISKFTEYFSGDVCYICSSLDQDKKETEEDSHIKYLKTRILIRKGDEDNLLQFKLEITDDSDISFLYTADVNEEEFEKISERYDIICSYEKWVDSVKEYLKNSVIDSDKIQLYLNLSSEEGNITFVQTLRMRKLVTYAIDISEAPDDYKMRLAQYRFNNLKLIYTERKNELQNALSKLEVKNPNLSFRIKEKMKKRDALRENVEDNNNIH